MDILVARLVHIAAGVIWAGTALVFARFVEPTVHATGEHGQSFMQEMERRGFTKFMTANVLVGILSGIYLYWRVSDGLKLSWITSGPGLTLTIGSITALVAFSFGPLFYIPTGKRIEQIGKQAAAAGGAPTPAQREEMARLAARLSQVGVWSAILLGVTVVTMATARYIPLAFG